jgi:hypothetical protein
MIKVHRVVVNGGLGNQLFQLAALLSSPKVAELEFDLSLGQFQSRTQVPEFITETKMPFHIGLHQERFLVTLKRKIANAILVLSEKNSYINLVILLTLRISLSGLMLLCSGQLLRIITSREMSRFSQGRIRGNCLLIGYFQTAEYVSIKRVKDQFVQLELADPARAEVIKKILGQVTNPTGIHYRLGDYRNEPKLGLLNDSYYICAMDKIQPVNENILLFSNEPIVAAQRFKGISTSSFILVPTELSATETLQLMRCCKKIVIANSSLSWWGAFIGESNIAEGNIVCPSPWFEFSQTSEGLLPSGWVKVNPWGTKLH